jgi:multiple antibiotic resistance protein
MQKQGGASALSYTLSSEKVLLEVAKSILLIISALFPIVNPIGGSPVFLALTDEYTTPARRLLAWRITLNSFLLIVGSYLIGTHILAFFGISIPVVQVGGGLIVISTGWAMLKQKDPDDRGQIQKNVNPADILRRAFYPLTLPLTVGPGTISVAITLGANAPRHLGGNLLAILSAVVGAAIVAATIYLCYGFADRLAVVLGPTGMNVILRLSSFLLVCIGVQIFWNGASTLLNIFLDSRV